MMLQTSKHFLAALSLAGGLIAGPCAAQNHIQNVGFGPGLSGWAWKGSARAKCVVDDAQHHWGRRCVRLTSGGGAGKLTKRVTGLTAGRTYCAYLWCKGDGAGSALQVGAGCRAALPTGMYGWRCVELGFIADAPGKNTATITGNHVGGGKIVVGPAGGRRSRRT